MIQIFRRKKDSDKTRFDFRDWLVLGGGIIVFLIITLPTLGASSIWFDEAFGAYMIRFSFGDIVHYTAADVHPPLFYWALKIWGSIFGTNEFALRSMSVFFGAIALLFAWLLARKWFGRRVAATALLMMAITPFFVRYSQEMRMYTMVTAIIFAATYVMTLADKSKKSWQWVIYGALVGLGMLTHYYSALIWVTHWIWRAIVYRSSGLKGKELRREYFSRGWIYAHLVALALFAPWIGAFVTQLSTVQANGFWISPFTPATPINFLTSVVLYTQVNSVQSWGALIFGGFVIGMIALIIRLNRVVIKDERRNYFLLIALMAAVPPFLLLLASLPPLRPTFVDRYVTASALSIGLLVGVALGLARNILTRRLWRAIMVATVLIFMYGVASVYWLGNFNTDTNTSNNIRQVIDEARAKAPNLPIIANTSWTYYSAVFYSTKQSPVYFIDANVEYKYGSLEMLKENDLGKIKSLGDFEAANQTFWYVGRPGTPDMTPPSAGLKVLNEFRINDTITGNAAYQAIEYQVL